MHSEAFLLRKHIYKKNALINTLKGTNNLDIFLGVCIHTLEFNIVLELILSSNIAKYNSYGVSRNSCWYSYQKYNVRNSNAARKLLAKLDIVDNRIKNNR